MSERVAEPQSEEAPKKKFASSLGFAAALGFLLCVAVLCQTLTPQLNSSFDSRATRVHFCSHHWLLCHLSLY
jgi:hypothetical protein